MSVALQYRNLVGRLLPVLNQLDLAKARRGYALDVEEISRLRIAKDCLEGEIGRCSHSKDHFDAEKFTCFRKAEQVLLDKTRLLGGIAPALFGTEMPSMGDTDIPERSLASKFWEQLLAERDRVLYFEEPIPGLHQTSDRIDRPLALTALAHGLQILAAQSDAEETLLGAEGMLEVIEDNSKRAALTQLIADTRQGRWREYPYYDIAEDVSHAGRINDALKQAGRGEWDRGAQNLLSMNGYFHPARALGLIRLLQLASQDGLLESTTLLKGTPPDGDG